MSVLEMIGAGFLLYITLGMIVFYTCWDKVQEVIDEEEPDSEPAPVASFVATVVAWPLIVIALCSGD
jgi:hypothetical protein